MAETFGSRATHSEPASAAIEPTAAYKQEYNDYDQKGCRVHGALLRIVDFSQMLPNTLSGHCCRRQGRNLLIVTYCAGGAGGMEEVLCGEGRHSRKRVRPLAAAPAHLQIRVA